MSDIDKSSILLLSQGVKDIDVASSIVGLITAYRSNSSRVDLLVLEPIEDSISDFFKKYSVEILKEVPKGEYQVIIDYSKSGVKQVSYDTDEQNKLLKFTITPKSEIFDFSSVKFVEGSSKYTHLYLFDIENLRNLEIYSDISELISDCNIYSVGSVHVENSLEVVDLEADESYSEKVYELLKKLSVSVNAKAAEIFMNGAIYKRKLLETREKNNTWSSISKMGGDGADISEGITKAYYSKDSANLAVQIKLVNNVKLDKKRKIIWSLVEYDDIKKHKLTRETLDTKGRIVFNISKDYDLAIAVYEINTQELLVVLQSNDSSKYSAIDIAGVFRGVGDKYSAECTIKPLSASEFEKRVFDVIDEVSGKRDDEILPKVIIDN